MTQNIGSILGKLAGAAIVKAAGTCTAGGKEMPVKGRVIKYSKPGKRPMPQPAYEKQGAMPFAALLASGAFDMPAEPPRKAERKNVRTPASKKPVAKGPIRGSMRMRGKRRGG